MTDEQRKARGFRAQQYNDEFLRPIIAENRDTYAARMVEIATTELNPRKRAEKLTALSVALKVLNNIESGIVAIIEDGKLADKALLRKEEIEKLGREQRRLLDIAPSWR